MEKIAVQFRVGDPTALEASWMVRIRYRHQLAGSLFAVAVRILGDRHEAEEVIQDVFVQIWDKAAIFDPMMAAPFTWALSITRNRSIDRLRSRQRRARL